MQAAPRAARSPCSSASSAISAAVSSPSPKSKPIQKTRDGRSTASTSAGQQRVTSEATACSWPSALRLLHCDRSSRAAHRFIEPIVTSIIAATHGPTAVPNCLPSASNCCEEVRAPNITAAHKSTTTVQQCPSENHADEHRASACGGGKPACDIVNRRNVIGVHPVAAAKAVCEQREDGKSRARNRVRAGLWWR